MIFFRTLRFLKYFLFSRHGQGHGIHSPFVFYLVSVVFRNKTGHEFVLLIENIRRKCKTDRRSVEIMDLGAGPSVKKTGLRKVSEIAKNSSVPAKYGILLSNMAARFGRPSILEFGTSLGISTMYLAAGCRDTIVYTVEGSAVLAGYARENFREAGLDNIRLFNGPFDDLLPQIIEKTGTPGLVFIDGNHRKEPVVRYFTRIAESSGNDTVVILDDIHLSDEMEQAWEEIKQSGKVSFTVDICRMGMVFFRKGMERVDYIIRY